MDVFDSSVHVLYSWSNGCIIGIYIYISTNIAGGVYLCTYVGRKGRDLQT